jgi:hypothetical protein
MRAAVVAGELAASVAVSPAGPGPAARRAGPTCVSVGVAVRLIGSPRVPPHRVTGHIFGTGGEAPKIK